MLKNDKKIFDFWSKMKPKIDPKIDVKINAKNDDFLDPLSKPVLVREREARYMLKRFVCFHFHGFW